MVKIRLRRMGATKRPMYRIVVADSRSPRDGRFIESIGFYDPLSDPAVVRIDEEKVRTWMRKGARPSDTARELLVRQGILAARPRPVRAPKPSAEATAPAPPAAAAAPATEAPAKEEPAPEAPATEEPAAEAPATEEPEAEAPAVEEPVAEEPAAETEPES